MRTRSRVEYNWKKQFWGTKVNNKWMNDFWPNMSDAVIFNKLGKTLTRLGIIDYMYMGVSDGRSLVCGNSGCCGYKSESCEVELKMSDMYGVYDAEYEIY